LKNAVALSWSNIGKNADDWAVVSVSALCSECRCICWKDQSWAVTYRPSLLEIVIIVTLKLTK